MPPRAKKFFQDYEVRQTVTGNGKVKRTYVYRGSWYTREIPDTHRKAEKILYLPLALLAAVLLMLAMLQNIAPNRSGVISVCAVLAVVPAFCVLLGAVTNCFQKTPYRKDSYHDRLLTLRWMPLLGAALCLTAAAGYLAYVLGAPEETGNGNGKVSLFCAAAAAVLYGILAWREFRIPYVKLPESPDAEAPENGAGGEQAQP